MGDWRFLGSAQRRRQGAPSSHVEAYDYTKHVLRPNAEAAKPLQLTQAQRQNLDAPWVESPAVGPTVGDNPKVRRSSGTSSACPCSKGSGCSSCSH